MLQVMDENKFVDPKASTEEYLEKHQINELLEVRTATQHGSITSTQHLF